MEKYHAADDVTKAKIMINPLKIFHQAVENCKPVLALMPLKRGGVTYQVRATKEAVFEGELSCGRVT
jgi:small subunit ribosomal protein S7